MKYNANLRMRDLFMNPKLAGVFPQFEQGEKLQKYYSFEQAEKRVRDYLVVALNGTLTEDGTIEVYGDKQAVLNRVKALQSVIETFVNDMPKVVQALKQNAPLYLPYATRVQLEKINTDEGRIKAIREVMDNFQYNPELGAINSVKREKLEQFARNQRAWQKKVGYRRTNKK